MTVLPFPGSGVWVSDVRDGGRAARISTHAHAGVVILSLWDGNTCRATLQLEPAAVAGVIAALANGLVDLERPGLILHTLGE